MEYVYYPRDDDEKIISEYKHMFELKTLEELVKAYNKEAKCGIVGVHRQALYLIALRKEFLERFGESPIYIVDKVVLGMVGGIGIKSGQLKILE
ncbi:hypothetical protein [Aestuariivivens sediminicola]|uniref:hypothetical protein n=1 Tax=Aestuariivivens sediminicola TaxID=2913560 RepID=UPI001F56A012|nr:hypothetical protein [Aestuariivivens sediminicola]